MTGNKKQRRKEPQMDEPNTTHDLLDYYRFAVVISERIRQAALQWLVENKPGWSTSEHTWNGIPIDGIPIDLADDEQLTVITGAALAVLWEAPPMTRHQLTTICAICDNGYPSHINSWHETNTNAGDIWWETCPHCGTQYEIRMSYHITHTTPRRTPITPAPQRYRGRKVTNVDLLSKYPPTEEATE